MGLGERRRIAQIKEQHMPRFQKGLNDAVGFELPFEIDVTTFPEDATVLDCYDFYYENYGPGLIVKVFTSICQDDLGKQTVRDTIKKIVFKNTAAGAEQPGEMDAQLDGKTLIVRESFHGRSDKLFGEPDLRAAIENML